MLPFIFNRRVLLSVVFISVSVHFMGSLVAQNQKVMTKKNKQLIEQGFAKWADGTGDFFDLLSSDVVWTITGKSPISKKYYSRIQLLDEAIAPLNARLSQLIVPRLLAIYADGDMVIALWEGRATAKDAVPYNNTYSWHMKMKKGKIIEVIAFFDTITLAALWERVPLITF
jgi:ketosteroid isomerase-like protein